MANLERVDYSTVRASLCKLPQACDAFHLACTLWMFDKSGTVQHIHQGLKYKNRPHYGLSLGKLMGQTFVLPLPIQSRPQIIMPIPLHRQRLYERGYNQSNLLARGMAKTTHVKLLNDILIRSSYTNSQTGLDQQKRLDNVTGAFEVRKNTSIQGKHIMLVDDVLTTGATLFAASVPLKKAGATEISIATLAMARP